MPGPGIQRYNRAMRFIGGILGVLVFTTLAFAQPGPTDPTHPAGPIMWNTYSPVHWGTVVDQVWVPPQPVAIQVYVPQPAGIPEKWETQYVEIPGYYAVRTTKGTVYPERWTLDTTAPGVHQWRKLPSYFQAR